MREGADAQEATFLVQEVEKLGQKLASVRSMARPMWWNKA